jgi:hypothetical protein
MMRAQCPAWVLAVSIFLVVVPAYADYMYVFDQSNYSVIPGGKVDVNVFLQETGNTTTVLRDVGLIGAGVQVRFDDPPQPSTPAEVLTNADVINNPQFEEVWNATSKAHPTLSYADLSLATFGTVFGLEIPLGSGTYRVALGTFTFTAGTVPGEVTHIRATDFSADSDTIAADANYTVLDSLIADGTATIITVPEPSALVLGVVAGLALVARCWNPRTPRSARSPTAPPSRPACRPPAF